MARMESFSCSRLLRQSHKIHRASLFREVMDTRPAWMRRRGSSCSKPPRMSEVSVPAVSATSTSGWLQRAARHRTMLVFPARRSQEHQHPNAPPLRIGSCLRYEAFLSSFWLAPLRSTGRSTVYQCRGRLRGGRASCGGCSVRRTPWHPAGRSAAAGTGLTGLSASDRASHLQAVTQR